MPQKRRMNALDFEAVRPYLKISTARIEAARAALVDGLTLQTIAEANGWTSRQTVNDAVDVVWNTLAKYRESQRATESYLARSTAVLNKEITPGLPEETAASKKKPGAQAPPGLKHQRKPSPL